MIFKSKKRPIIEMTAEEIVSSLEEYISNLKQFSQGYFGGYTLFLPQSIYEEVESYLSKRGELIEWETKHNVKLKNRGI